MKIILHKEDNKILVTYPFNENDIIIIADKNVKAGILYKIYDSELLPNEPQETWELEINESNADGIGLTKEEFKTKYPQYKGWAVQ